MLTNWRPQRESEGDSNPPIKAVGEGKVLTNWQAIVACAGLIILGTLGWAAVKHDQADLSAKFTILSSRQDALEVRFAEQHDLLTRLGINVDYLAAGRRGPTPAPTIVNPP